MTRRAAPLDHWLLVRRYPIEIERARSAVIRAVGTQKPGVLELWIAHDDDGRCCATEPWPETLVELLALLPPAIHRRPEAPPPFSDQPPDQRPIP